MDNLLILFQGDSITDAGRDRDNSDSLGSGYPMFADALFKAANPGSGVKFINRGIGGNRAADLVDRWQEDCLDLNPDIVSILIGINDCWRRFDNNDPTTAEEYKKNYHEILTKTKQSGAEIVIIEPFVLPTPADRAGWRIDLDPKIQAARELAKEFEALYIPMDGIFASAAIQSNNEMWLPDGVHPSAAGHALIANTWLETVFN